MKSIWNQVNLKGSNTKDITSDSTCSKVNLSQHQLFMAFHSPDTIPCSGRSTSPRHFLGLSCAWDQTISLEIWNCFINWLKERMVATKIIKSSKIVPWSFPNHRSCVSFRFWKCILFIPWDFDGVWPLQVAGGSRRARDIISGRFWTNLAY